MLPFSLIRVASYGSRYAASTVQAAAGHVGILCRISDLARLTESCAESALVNPRPLSVGGTLMSAQPVQDEERQDLVTDEDEFADEEIPELESRRTPDDPEGES